MGKVTRAKCNTNKEKEEREVEEEEEEKEEEEEDEEEEEGDGGGTRGGGSEEKVNSVSHVFVGEEKKRLFAKLTVCNLFDFISRFFLFLLNDLPLFPLSGGFTGLSFFLSSQALMFLLIITAALRQTNTIREGEERGRGEC